MQTEPHGCIHPGSNRRLSPWARNLKYSSLNLVKNILCIFFCIRFHCSRTIPLFLISLSQHCSHQKHSPIFNATQKTASSTISTHSKESALLLFECLSKCHPLSHSRWSTQRISYLAFFSPLLPRYSTYPVLDVFFVRLCEWFNLVIPEINSSWIEITHMKLF